MNQQHLSMMRAHLEELEAAYRRSPSNELLDAIFQLKLAIQELEAGQA